MAFAQGSRSQLAYVEETTFGVTPTTPATILVPFSSHTLNLTKQRLQGNDILADRIPRIDRHGNRNAAGDLVCDLRDTDYDPFIESVFFSAFPTSGVMTVGTTLKSFTIEDMQLDINQYRVFTGMAVNSMNMSIAPNQMVTTTFNFVGADMSISGTSIDATPTAASGGEPYDSYSGSINEGGSAIAIVTSLDVTITNSLAPTFVVGSASTPQLEFGRCEVEGTLTAYFENATLMNKFLNETVSTLDFTLDDPVTGSTLKFEMNEVKYLGADLPVADPQSRILTMPFVALYDATDTSNIKVTRT